MNRSQWIAMVWIGLLGVYAARADEAPPNDACTNAAIISGIGVFEFDNGKATTDGPFELSCGFPPGGDNYIANDVWFCWTSTCSGPATVDSCGSTVVDTKIAIYDRCDCPPNSKDSIACDNDSCVFQSSATFVAEAGQNYLIQIGTVPIVDESALDGGSGSFTIECDVAPDPPCTQPATRCRLRDRWDALKSDRVVATVADDFTPTSDGAITQICWWGAYRDGGEDCENVPSDSFEIRYYSDNGGAPGQLIGGPYSQASGTLTVQGPERTYEKLMSHFREYEYSASHAPVQINGNQCYWVEITNSPASSCQWYWEVARNGNYRAFLDDELGGYAIDDAIAADLAICLNVETSLDAPCANAPANDACTMAPAVTDGVVVFDTTLATTGENPDLLSCAFTHGDEMIQNDVWFNYTATCTGVLRVHTCGSQFDTKLAVYAEAPCASLSANPLGCNDNRCGPDQSVQSMVSMGVNQGEAFKIRVGGYEGVTGPGTLAISCHTPPLNDTCASVIPLTIPDTWTGNNVGATTECDDFRGGDVWIAFTLADINSARVEYTGGGSVFPDAWRGLGTSCGCNSFLEANRIEGIENGGIVLTWDCLAAGTYYYPIVADPSVEGDYEVTVTSGACAAPCQISTDDCCSSQDGRGCGDAPCCELICGFDPYCCGVSWDSLCARRARALCSVCPENACDASESDCFSSHLEPGCNHPTVCQSVCACQPHCCLSSWDESCIVAGDEQGCGADDFCNVAAIPPTCEEGDLDCNGTINKRDHRYSVPCIEGPCLADICEPPIEFLPCCAIGDFDEDGDLDLRDHGSFQNVYDHP